MEEKELIKRIKLGDKTAEEEIFMANVKWAVNLSYIILRDWNEAEDAVQNAFVNLFKSIEKFDDEKEFKPWFTRIVVNDAKKLRRKGLKRLFISDFNTFQHDETGIADSMVLAEEKNYILDEIYKLKEKYRIPIILKYFSSFSEKQISEALNLPISTVKSRLYIGRQELKKSLLSYEEGNLNEA